MKSLKHGQQVKYKDLRWEPRITVSTLEGSVPKYFKTIEEAWTNHNEFSKNNPWTNNPTAWVLKDSAMICADYPGKAEDHANAHDDFINATMLEDGEEVEIEGRKYLVKIVKNANYVSDPIHFVEIAG